MASTRTRSGSTRRILIIILVAIAALGVIAAIAFVPVRNAVRARNDARDYAKAVQVLSEGEIRHALTIIALRKGGVPPVTGPEKDKEKWWRLEVEAAVKGGDLGRLLRLYEQVPAYLLANERGSNLVAQVLLAREDHDGFAKVRAVWRGKEQHRAWWLGIDAKQLVDTGKRDQAIALLSSTTLPGTEDAQRLLLLSRHLFETEPQRALDILNQAVAVNPRDPEVRDVRARIFERMNRLPRARVEFLQAIAADPDNPLRHDELAEFYRRHGEYPQMVIAVRRALRKLGPEYLWLKLAFWSRVAQQAARPDVVPEVGNLQPLLAYVDHLPTDAFWDEKAWLGMPKADGFERDRQEVFWLRLLQLLKERREREAFDLLAANPFRKKCWNRNLDSALHQVLTLRLRGEVTAPRQERIGLVDAAAVANRHPGLRQFDELASGGLDAVAQARLVALAKGPYAFAALCAAVGWNEAALLLLPAEPLSIEAPDWCVNDLAALQHRLRGAAAARAWALAQPDRPALRLVVAEIDVFDGKSTALPVLAELARDPGEVGSTAAQLLAGVHIGAKRWAEAEATVQAQARLAASPAGKELLAKAALGREDLATAERIYQELGPVSLDGIAFQLVRARTRKDAKEARRLADLLLEAQPDNPQLLAAMDQLKVMETGGGGGGAKQP